MIVFKKEAAVERVIDFVSKFATSLGKVEDKDEETEDEMDSVADNRLLQELIDFLLSVSWRTLDFDVAHFTSLAARCDHLRNL